eukprot:m.332674 g.332674  ORF g.332674 m.332674 type:complete len:123 (-) comp16986_c0_seq1:117-485(-)
MALFKIKSPRRTSKTNSYHKIFSSERPSKIHSASSSSSSSHSDRKEKHEKRHEKHQKQQQQPQETKMKYTQSVRFSTDTHKFKDGHKVNSDTRKFSTDTENSHPLSEWHSLVLLKKRRSKPV